MLSQKLRHSRSIRGKVYDLNNQLLQSLLKEQPEDAIFLQFSNSITRQIDLDKEAPKMYKAVQNGAPFSILSGCGLILIGPDHRDAVLPKECRQWLREHLIISHKYIPLRG